MKNANVSLDRRKSMCLCAALIVFYTAALVGGHNIINATPIKYFIRLWQVEKLIIANTFICLQSSPV